MQTSTLSGVKMSDYLKFIARTSKRTSWASAGILRTRRKVVQFFAILCGRLLWTKDLDKRKANLKKSKVRQK